MVLSENKDKVTNRLLGLQRSMVSESDIVARLQLDPHADDIDHERCCDAIMNLVEASECIYKARRCIEGMTSYRINLVIDGGSDGHGSGTDE